MAERARDVIRQICQARDVVIAPRRGIAGITYICCCQPRRNPVPGEIGAIRQGIAPAGIWMQEFPELRKRYWGQHMWARGVRGATVGAVDEATIKAYIESQKWDEDDHCLKDRQRPPSLELRLSAGYILQTACAVLP